jgi:carboxyl-terminal processing protease
VKQWGEYQRLSIQRMISPRAVIRRWTALCVLVACPVAVFAGAEHTFTTSETLSEEAQTLVQLLESDHYNRGAVTSSDYQQVIPEYMAALDQQHLFFLDSDKKEFLGRYGSNVYYNVSYLGKIDAAYDIFGVYDKRMTSRVGWIFAELKKDFDFTTNDSFRLDRSKSEWPTNTAEADELWRKRLKFELLAELLNKKTLDQAREVVRKRYERILKTVGETEATDLSETFLSTIAGLYDPHSTYMSADFLEDFSIQMRLQLVGIGAMLGLEDDVCTVKEIVPGGPADLNRQLKPNDKIIAVGQDGTEPVEIIGFKLRKIVDMIRGGKGTRVHLIVQPASATDTSVRKEIVITRDVVKLDSARARAAVFQVPGPGGKTVPLGVVTLPAFYGPGEEGDTDADKTSASDDVAKLVDQLKQAGIQGLVLDLRHNGGGYLSEAIRLASLFIHRGPVVQVRSSEGEIQVESDDAEHLDYSGPMAVLVDRFSASASEIVAGALQDYGRAVVIGDSSTHGKGTVQAVIEMNRVNRQLARSTVKTGAAKITIQKFYLPDGSSTQFKGVVSDIVLPSVDEFRQDHHPEVLPARRLVHPIEGRRLRHRAALRGRVPPDRGVRPAARPRLGQDPDELLRRRPDRREGAGPPAREQRRAPGGPRGVRVPAQVRGMVQGARVAEADFAQLGGSQAAEGGRRRLQEADQARAREAGQGRLCVQGIQAWPSPSPEDSRPQAGRRKGRRSRLRRRRLRGHRR